ncbi:MAG TPA: endonuclease MutS2 [Fimbriimonadaceae bacterium]|nr:endonuclease MutS2 [Fimbriimonadaceae bacterium]
MNHALQVLEFGLVTERLASHSETPLGAELCAQLAPTYQPDEVWRRLGATEEAHRLLAEDPPPSLAPLHDPRDLFNRAGKGGALEGIEVYRCAAALGVMRQLKTYFRTKGPIGIAAYADSFPDQTRLEERLLAAVSSGGDVLDSASAQLAALRARKGAAAHKVVERVQAYLSGKSREWLSDPIYTVRDGRYVLPVKAEYKARIKGIVHDTSGSGATVFVEPDDVLQLGNALREIELAERDEVLRILAELSAKIGGVATEAVGGVEAASTVDSIFARARLAYADRGFMPRRVEGHFIALHAARHPLLRAESVVPLDIEVGQGASVLITGPNTGGKTVAIKSVGLAVAMAQSGLFPPALDVRLAPFTGLWADIGDEQSLQQSLSTFSGHLKNIAEALRGAETGALVLFDELGAGTDPAEGAALATVILERLHAEGCAILASTHYGELKAFAYETAGFTNAAMEFDMKTLRPTYKLLMGAAGASQALRIAERYGIPKELIEEAREGLGRQAQNVSALIEELDRAQRHARTAQSEADRRIAELRKAETETARKLAEAEERRAQARRRGAEAIDDALREIRLEAARVFEELKKDPTQAGFARAKQALSDLDEVGRAFAADLGPRKSAPPVDPVTLKRGMSVRIEGYPQVGTLLEAPTGKSATVQLGPLKMTVPIERVRPVDEKPTATVRPRTNIGLSRAQTATTEIHLRARRAEEAEDELNRFIDEALLAGLPSVRIVHGKGEGVLRKVTRELLRRHKGVRSFRDGEPGEGGAGVTVAEFE